MSPEQRAEIEERMGYAFYRDVCELEVKLREQAKRAEAAETALAELRVKVEAWQRTAQQAHYEHGGVDWDALSALLGTR